MSMTGSLWYRLRLAKAGWLVITALITMNATAAPKIVGPTSLQAFGGVFEKHDSIMGWRGLHKEEDDKFGVIILYRPHPAITLVNNNFSYCDKLTWYGDGRLINGQTQTTLTSESKYFIGTSFDESGWRALKAAKDVDFYVCNKHYSLTPAEQTVMQLVEKYTQP